MAHLRMPAADDTAGPASGVRTRTDDYDPDVLEQRAERLCRAAALALEAQTLPNVRRLVIDAHSAAAQLRRLAADVRVLERFLSDCGWFAEDVSDGTAQDRAG